ncbi:MAG: hypothetical protein WDW38_002203 [Sanguina aurantia]
MSSVTDTLPNADQHPAAAQHSPTKGSTQRSLRGFLSFLITPSASIAIQENSSWRVELRAVLALAFPVILQTASQQAMLITDQMFLGRLGTAQMAAAAIGNTWLNLMWYFLMGCSSALDTLGSQAYGAGDRTALVTWSFSAFLVLTTLCVPVSMWSLIMMKYLQTQNVMALPAMVTVTAFFLNIGANAVMIPIFGFVGSAMATSSTRIIQFFMMMAVVYYYEHNSRRVAHEQLQLLQLQLQQQQQLPTSSSCCCSSSSSCSSSTALILPTQRFRFTQDHVSPRQEGAEARAAAAVFRRATAAAAAAVAAALLQSLRCPQTGLSMCHLLCKFQEVPALGMQEVVSYVWAQSRAACDPRTMWTFLKIGIPGGLCLAFEFGAFEVTTALAGRLGTTKVAAHTAMLLITTMTYFCGGLPLATAASIRVGNLLGAGFPKTARLTSLISISLSTAFMAVMAVLLLTLRNQLGHIYTDDPEVGYWMSVIAPLTALFQVFDGVMGTSQGALSGCGRQHQLMFINLFGFWVCGVLVGALLCFKAGMGLRGLWWGTTIGDIVTAVISFSVFLRVDWDKEALIAKERQEEQQALDEAGKDEEDPQRRLLQPKL